MTRLEKVTGTDGHAVGGTASLADIVLFSLMTEVSMIVVPSSTVPQGTSLLQIPPIIYQA